MIFSTIIEKTLISFTGPMNSQRIKEVTLKSRKTVFYHRIPQKAKGECENISSVSRTVSKQPYVTPYSRKTLCFR